MVPPGEFIDAVERSPLIRDMGRYALAEALESLDGWGGAVRAARRRKHRRKALARCGLHG